MCKHPLKGFPIGIWPDSGKPKYKIVSYNTDFVRFDGDRWHALQGVPFGDYVSDFIEIPCGQCIECRLQYARDWANRCMLEAQYHDENWFLTLTYDDDHLPDRHELVNCETGEIVPSPIVSLDKDELSAFMKRLRKNTGQKIRFFGCGEYGDETHRPHYHVIIFGLHLNDLKIYKTNFRGEILYNSPIIDKAWQQRGHAVLAECSWDTCCYVARYVTKKLKGKSSEIYEDLGIYPPFVRMSRDPGIARYYYDDNKDKIYDYDKILLSTSVGGRSFKPPRYYDKLYDVEYPSDMAAIKLNRQFVAEKVKTNKLKRTDLSYLEMLAIEEDTLINRLGHLKERSKI